MGVTRLPNLKLYWQKSSLGEKLDLRNNFIINLLSYTQYTFIRSYFRLTFFLDNAEPNTKSIVEKTSKLIISINILFRSMFIPSKEICINESTIPFKGRCQAKVYNPDKPDK